MKSIYSVISRSYNRSDNEEIFVTNNGRYYYLKTRYTMLDMDMAKMINKSLNEYTKHMITNFGAFMNKGIKFSNKKSAEDAKYWIESMIIMNKLIGDR